MLESGDHVDDFAEGFMAGFKTALEIAQRFPGMSSDTITDAAIMNDASFAAASRTKKKRAPTAYQKWAAKERPKIVRQHPRFSFGRVNKELGKRWRSSSKNPKNKGRKR